METIAMGEMIGNSVFFRPEHAKHICTVFIKKLCGNVSPPVINQVLALSYVTDYIMKFVFFNPITYEQAIRRAINKEIDIYNNFNYIGPAVYTPFHYFYKVLCYISKFCFSEKYFYQEGRGKIGNRRRPITKHDPQPKYASYKIEVHINSQKKFRCCVCSSCGEFQIKHYNSWSYFEITTTRNFLWNYSKASPKVICKCGLDGEYGSSYER